MNKTNTKVTKGMGRRAALALLVLGGFLLAAGAAPAADKNGPIPSLVRVLEVGRPVTHQGLTIVPVYRTDAPRPKDWVMFDEAVKNGWIEVGELDGGRVPQVRISNLSKRTIYLMGGEILTGARQDRILASDLLLGPGTRNLVVPVFCVEHGRWTAVSPGFTTKNNIGTYDLRAKAMAKGEAAQTEIWDRVAEQNARVGAASPTGAYQDAYESAGAKKQIAEIEDRMTAIPRLMKDTVGVVIGLGGRIVSADLFADPALFQKQWPKILRSSALAALGRRGEGSLKPEAAADFLKALLDKDYQIKKGLDLGFEHSFLDKDVNVQALVVDQAVAHLAAFAQEDDRTKVTGTDGPEQRIRVIRDGR
ncbi:MAG: hypothetical protein NTZ26_00310 [Candidatus Aminicenantes bacterium]|nr:hypothetical protein [Candidatus Aminicenantes bacterium]